jgi:hypothetical protein
VRRFQLMLVWYLMVVVLLIELDWQLLCFFTEWPILVHALYKEGILVNYAILNS